MHRRKEFLHVALELPLLSTFIDLRHFNIEHFSVAKYKTLSMPIVTGHAGPICAINTRTVITRGVGRVVAGPNLSYTPNIISFRCIEAVFGRRETRGVDIAYGRRKEVDRRGTTIAEGLGHAVPL